MSAMDTPVVSRFEDEIFIVNTFEKASYVFYSPLEAIAYVKLIREGDAYVVPFSLFQTMYPSCWEWPTNEQ